MQTTQCIVRRIDGSRVEVEVVQEGCGRCNEPGGCGGQSLARATCHGRRYWIASDSAFHVGQRVMVAIDAESVRSAAGRAYVIPMLLLLLGAYLGAQFGSGASVAGGIIGLSAGWYWLTGSRKAVGTPVILGGASDER